MIRYHCLIFCLLLVACQQSGSKDKPLYFFDVNRMISQEVERLNKLRPVVKKTVSLNGDSEQRERTDIEWEDELSIFSGADINKAAWTDKYRVDTVFINKALGQFSQIDHTALDENMKCQNLSVYFLRNTTTAYKLKAQLHRKNFLYEISQDIGITLGESYFINSYQKVLFLDEKRFEVRAEFVR